MGFWSRRPELLDGPAELADIEPALRAAAERLRRDLAKHASRPTNDRRIGPALTRLPSIQLGRPVRRPLLLPQRARSGMPPTVLERERGPGERPPLAAAVEENARRVERAIRGRHTGLRGALEGLRRRLGGSSR